ncbi:MAG: carbohydrate porin [Xanthomonadales bacterium]|nr:carbohydrate porin [Xanthomonadaceae bacterium]MBN8224112.1 carbohydrate porin [Xanthomonadales bacterium]MCA0196530.1 carbohydrate porin [Pseudomonadota bacterium]
MRHSLLAVAIAMGLGGTVSFEAAAADTAEVAALKAALAQLQAQQAELVARVAELETRTDAQSDVNIEQAKTNESVVPAVDSLKKLVNDTKVGGRIFFDVTSRTEEVNGVRTNNTGTGFDVTRMYLSVDHKFDNVWSANLTSDAQYLSFGSGAGANQAHSVEVFIKKAYVQAKWSDALFMRVGAADTPWVPFVEKYYGMRYVNGVLYDRLSYGTSADWGLHIGGETAGGFNYAAAIINGRGYRNPSRSQRVDFEGRVGWAPTPYTVVAVGAYTGQRGNNTATVDPPHTARRLSAMAAYADTKMRLGAEWFTADNWAVTNTLDDTASGWSAWASYALTKSGITAFGRYDDADTSKKLNPSYNNAYWHLGVEFPVVKGVKLSAVYKDTTAKAAKETRTRELGVWGDVQF